MPKVVNLFHIVGDRVVEPIARALNRSRGDNAAEADHRNVDRAAAHVYHHVAARLLDGDPAPIAASTDSLTTYALRAPARIAASTTARRSVEVTPVGTETITSGLKS
jgi:hypothetical protein